MGRVQMQPYLSLSIVCVCYFLNFYAALGVPQWIAPQSQGEGKLHLPGNQKEKLRC